MFKTLIVDDEAFFRTSFRSFINWNELGCDVIGEAVNGVDAIKKIHALKPDIVFLDIEMPLKNGIDVLIETQNDAYRPAFIILSSYDVFDYVRRAMRLGAKDYIHKASLDAASLKESIDRVKKITGTYSSDNNIISSNNSAPIRTTIEQILRYEVIADLEIDKLRDTFGHSLYAVTMMSVLNYDNIELKYGEKQELFHQGIFNLLSEIWKNNDKVFFFQFDKKRICVVSFFDCHLAKKQIDEELQYYAEKCKTYLHKFMNIDILIGFSDFHNRIEELNRAAEESLFTLLILFSHNHIAIGKFVDVRFMSRMQIVLECEDFENLKKAIMNKSHEAVMSVIYNIFNFDTNRNYIEPANARYTAYHLIYSASQSLSPVNPNTLAKIDQADTLVSLKTIILDAIQTVFIKPESIDKTIYSGPINDIVSYIAENCINQSMSLVRNAADQNHLRGGLEQLAHDCRATRRG